MSSTLLNDLNEKQIEAVKHTTGPSVILAGAGSGKTKVLVSKVVHLIQDKSVVANSIVMITFTNKAASEMKERIARAFVKNKKIQLGYVGTFHAFCCRILRIDGHNLGIDRNFAIYDDNDQQELVKWVLKKMDTKKYTPSYFLYRISAAKNQLITPNTYLEFFSDYNAAQVADVYDQYQKLLEKNKALDFDDLLMKATTLFTRFPAVLDEYQEKYKYLLVDEFQDTNYAQYVLTKQLGAKYKNVTVVGDFSQSIYSWRGADIRNLEKFQEDFPDSQVFYLEQNYRSTQSILNFAYEVISKNQTHPVLQLFTTNSEGEKIYTHEADNEEDESIFVSSEIQRLQEDNLYSSFAVLYRTNAQSRAIEESFLHFGIPYVLIGGVRFYDRKEIKDILSYLRLIINPDDEIAIERIKKLGKRKWDRFKHFFAEIHSTKDELTTVQIMDKVFTETSYLDLYNPDLEEDYARLENIKELKSVAINFPVLTEFLEQVALVESEYFQGERKGNSNEGVRLMTLHQAKGLEFPYVFIVGLEEGLLPHSRSINDMFQLEEERRLFYVGITRAKKKLYITFARRRFIFGRRTDGAKSRFLGGGEEADY
ncbi:MAG: UvrD-helicase domain-containing protein [bacterium]|nr:UvrD-helicase domain-containing protein [bacterium]